MLRIKKVRYRYVALNLLALLLAGGRSEAFAAVDCDLTLKGYTQAREFQKVIDTESDVTGDKILNVCLQNVVVFDGTKNGKTLVISKPGVRLTGIGTSGSVISASGEIGIAVDIQAPNVSIDNVSIFASGKFGTALSASRASHFKLMNSKIFANGLYGYGVYVANSQVDSIENSIITAVPPESGESPIAFGVYVMTGGSIGSISKSKFVNIKAPSTSIFMVEGHIGSIKDIEFSGPGVAMNFVYKSQVGSIARIKSLNAHSFLSVGSDAIVGSVRDIDVTLGAVEDRGTGIRVDRGGRVGSMSNLSFVANVPTWGSAIEVANGEITSISGFTLQAAPSIFQAVNLTDGKILLIDDFVVTQVGVPRIAIPYAPIQISSYSGSATKQIETLSNGFIAFSKLVQPILGKEFIGRQINVITQTR